MNEKIGLDLLDFLPTGIDKTDPIIQAVFSNDDGEGAIANELEALTAYIRYYTETDDARNHYGYTLEMITRLFAKMRRQLEERDERLLRRMLSLTERKGDSIWGTARNIGHVFETYFSGIKTYVCENTNADTLLENGDFEEDDVWELRGTAEYTAPARFSGMRGLFFDGTPGACSQTIEGLTAGIYTIHFFLLGACGVRITNQRGQYWNAKAEPDNYILRWEEEPVTNYFETADWKDAYCFIVLPEADILTIEFVSADGKEGNIDYARLFLKPRNPSYTVVIQYEGFTISDKTLHLGSGGEDPIDGINYGKASYFDHSYIIGRIGAYRGEVYSSLLNIVRPCGIQAFIDFVEKIQLPE